MAQVKEYLWMPYYQRLAMLIVFEDWILCDAVFLSQPFLQQLIGQHAEPLPLFKLELERLFPALRRDLLQRCLKIKLPDILTYQYLHHEVLKSCSPLLRTI